MRFRPIRARSRVFQVRTGLCKLGKEDSSFSKIFQIIWDWVKFFRFFKAFSVFSCFARLVRVGPGWAKFVRTDASWVRLIQVEPGFSRLVRDDWWKLVRVGQGWSKGLSICLPKFGNFFSIFPFICSFDAIRPSLGVSISFTDHLLSQLQK